MVFKGPSSRDFAFRYVLSPPCLYLAFRTRFFGSSVLGIGDVKNDRAFPGRHAILASAQLTLPSFRVSLSLSLSLFFACFIFLFV